MEREKVSTININSHKKIKAKTRSISIVSAKILSLLLPVLPLVIVSSFNLTLHASLINNSKHNYVMQAKLEQLQKENSVLEGKKSDLINLKEIQAKAETLGLEYNNSINYLR